VCVNVALVTYNYLGQDSIVENRFSWDNGAWEYYGQEFTFKGPEVYSSRPDSVIYYYKPTNSMVDIPLRRRYLHYEELGNDEIYFKEEQFFFFEAINEWVLTRLIEEWYHIKALDDEGFNNLDEGVFTFPNPSTIGGVITIGNQVKGKGNLQVLIYDMQGRLISTSVLKDQSTFQAPNRKGVYNVLILEEDQLIGVVKQLIIE